MVRINYEIKDSQKEQKGDIPLRFWIERPSTPHQKSSTSNNNVSSDSTFNEDPLPDSSELNDHTQT